MKLLSWGCKGLAALERGCNFFAPLADLVARVWVSEVFFSSAWVKVQSFEQTLNLFEHEYNVPLLPAEIAAYLGTAVEFVAPILLAVGIFGRLPALALFLFNIVAVISYEFLWTLDGQVGLTFHIHWGLLLMLLLVHGNGKWSLDTLLERWCKRS